MKKRSICILLVMMIFAMISINVFAATDDSEEVDQTIKNDVLKNALAYKGNYYLFITTELTWEQARLYCEGLGGHLATVATPDEDDFCHEIFLNSRYSSCWLGGTDETKEGEWEWVTSEIWLYENWGGPSPEEPDGGKKENYLNYLMHNPPYDEGNWNDYAGDKKLPFICEWEKEDIEHVRGQYGYLTSTNTVYDGAFYYNGHIYKIFEASMTSEKAKTYCESVGGHLATITSKEEDQALYSYVSKMKTFDCVFGGSDERIEGKWEWVTGESFEYTNWDEGEPNDENGEDYFHFTDMSGKWNDCDWKNFFMCEWEDCCISSNGIVSSHQFGEERVIKNPTCTSKGTSEQSCLGCGAVITHEIPKTAHSYGEWIVRKQATCYSAGEKIRKCTGCDLSQTEPTDIADHQWGEWRTMIEPLCSRPGTDERYCVECGKIESRDIEPLTHRYSEHIIEPTCLNVGSKQRICDECGNIASSETPPAKGHAAGPWRVSLDATCIDNGLRQQMCEACGVIINDESTEPKGHTFGKWKVIAGNALVPPIIKEHQCTICNASEIQKDWSGILILCLAIAVVSGAVAGIVTYVRYKKRHF